MSLHDELRAAAVDAEDWHTGYVIPVADLDAILARHPAPTVSDGEREAIINELHAVEGMLGLSHYRGEKLTADEMNQGRTVLESARECIAAGYRNRPMPSVEDVADHLRLIHFDGTGCGTTGTSACSNCYGPSPMSAREVATAVLALFNPKEES